MTTLSANALKELGTSVAVPQYNRNDLSPGIVHFGVGNFHRAHQALFLHNLFDQGKNHDWAIIGAGVMEEEKTQYEHLKRQDFLSTLVEQSAEESKATVLGSMIDFIAPTDTKAIVDTLTRKEIRIVSLTITEGGYFLTDKGDFDITNKAIQTDGACPEDPKTVFGILVKALRLRQKAGVFPFAVMSCDNIPHNGYVARNAVCGVARIIDPGFSEWITYNVSFPNSMVDRITPVTGDRERQLLQEMYGITDRVPVFCEDFRQWVIEDKFPHGRPKFEDVGVQFVSDVNPYEAMKIRILNGGHASIGYPAGLMDIEFVHEAMENDLIKSFLIKLESEEILSVVPDAPDTKTDDYLQMICKRFANPKIGDTIRRLCWDGSNRQPKFIVPTIQDRIGRNAGISGLALVSALWCRYCAGKSDSGAVVEPNDLLWDSLHSVATTAQSRPSEWLAQTNIYGNLAKNEVFVQTFTKWLKTIQEHGAEGALRSYVQEES